MTASLTSRSTARMPQLARDDGTPHREPRRGAAATIGPNGGRALLGGKQQDGWPALSVERSWRGGDASRSGSAARMRSLPARSTCQPALTALRQRLGRVAAGHHAPSGGAGHRTGALAVDLAHPARARDSAVLRPARLRATGRCVATQVTRSARACLVAARQALAGSCTGLAVAELLAVSHVAGFHAFERGAVASTVVTVARRGSAAGTGGCHAIRCGRPADCAGPGVLAAGGRRGTASAGGGAPRALLLAHDVSCTRGTRDRDESEN
jgi:hypothetical protein